MWAFTQHLPHPAESWAAKLFSRMFLADPCGDGGAQHLWEMSWWFRKIKYPSFARDGGWIFYFGARGGLFSIIQGMLLSCHRDGSGGLEPPHKLPAVPRVNEAAKAE